MAVASEELFPAHRMPWLTRLHLVALLLAAGLTVVGASLIPDLEAGPLLAVLGLGAVFELALLVYLERRGEAGLAARTRTRLIEIQLALDVAGLSVLLHNAGGSENPFFPFYVFPVILAAALLSRTAALGFAGLASLVYAALLAAEATGWLPHQTLDGLHNPAMYQNATYLVGQALALATTCFLAAAATTVLMNTLRARANDLAEAHRRAETRATQLRELNEQLRAANEECRHSREHMDDLYLELQQAYTRLEVRSRNMSELNEQLRAANAECSRQRDELANLNDQLRTANEKLSALEDARAQFTLLVTHELRAPVAAIQSYLKLILDGYVKPEKVQETLEKAEKRALEQLALIADLLELGRIQTSNARGQMEAIQVERALLEQMDLMAARAQERGITMHAEVDPDLPPVWANNDQIRSVWNNLISNAIKYNRDNGHVEIALKCEGNRVTGLVRDTGIGIPPEAMARLFAEFFRAENAKAASRMGTGLGLSIVKEIIERSGGQIVCESVLETGTTFRFWLPVVSQKAAVPARR